MNKLLSYILLTTILLFSFKTVTAQQDIPFSAKEKMYVKGNSLLIGNTILGKHKTKPFDSKKTANDVIDMKYVDIDNDKSTFSSSAAEILIPETSSRIVYAGLYWSGLYPGEKSTMRLGKQRAYYKTKGDRSSAIDSVLIKTEGTPYTKIKGEFVFDSNKKGPYKKDAPYVCRANITDYLNSIAKPNGMFTVANINAIRGKLEGGSAAGWLLYIVFEDVTQTPKYFTTYDGFTQIAKEEALVTFKDFQAKEVGPTSSTLVMAALEGDIKIKSDQCSILNQATGSFITLFNDERDKNNFFNSSITTSEISAKRNPSSQNTLGFDLVKTNLPDNIIKNSATEATIKLKTKADRFYLFFTAFETEIEETYLLSKNKNALLKPAPLSTIQEMESPMDNPIITAEKQMPKKGDTIKVIEAVKIIEEDRTVVLDTVQNTIKKIVPPPPPIVQAKKTPTVVTIKIDGMASGYYLVTNVFSNPKLAEKWSTKLVRDGYNPQSFINPKNNWTYVYVERSNILVDVKKKQIDLSEKEGFEKVWIARIKTK